MSCSRTQLGEAVGIEPGTSRFVVRRSTTTPRTPCVRIEELKGTGQQGTSVTVWPALATVETSQVLLAGVSSSFSRGFPVFAPPTDWPISYELK